MTRVSGFTNDRGWRVCKLDESAVVVSAPALNVLHAPDTFNFTRPPAPDIFGLCHALIISPLIYHVKRFR